MTTLILGIGNLLMGDEGVGIHVVRKLEAGQSLPGVEILDGGTGGFHLLGHFQNYDRVVLIDATMDGQPPGTLARLEPRFSSEYPPTLTAHDVGLKDLLDALFLLDTQPHIVLFTISINEIRPMTLDLSPDVQAAVPRAAEAVVEYLQAP